MLGVVVFGVLAFPDPGLCSLLSDPALVEPLESLLCDLVFFETVVLGLGVCLLWDLFPAALLSLLVEVFGLTLLDPCFFDPVLRFVLSDLTLAELMEPVLFGLAVLETLCSRVDLL